METTLRLDILAQPDNTTCGPTCLHAIYRYFHQEIPLDQVIAETGKLPDGGTLAVFLGAHALSRGFRATIFTYNLEVFDPTWFAPSRLNLRERLTSQLEFKSDPRLHVATQAYLVFLAKGGRLRFEDLTARLIRRYLNRGTPILTGLSTSYLYRTARERPESGEADNVRGEPSGHFVILAGYRREKRTVLVCDPMSPNPVAPTHTYEVNIDRVVGAILLGVLTHDANLLIIEPTHRHEGH
jgi:hypothetical protein